MLDLYCRRNGQWLEFDAIGYALNAAQSSASKELAVPQAGSHPHHLRQWLLASSLFPEKWLGRLFSIGGIKWIDDRIGLLAFPAADVRKDPLYRKAEEKGRIGIEAQGARIEELVLYEDDYCLVLNKPAGIPVHASYDGQSGTLDDMAAAYLLQNGDPLPVRHIHRLDDETSGPVLYSKNDLAQLRLDAAMREKAIDRKYVALVEGAMKKSAGAVREPIGKDRHHPSRRRVTPSGDEAVTHYEVLQKLPELTLVSVQLETGRTHQIRVHMSYIGHPLTGDSLYGGSPRWLSHQALHGEQLTFPHPLTGLMVNVQAPWPQWLERLTKR
ncbi:RluA family pseudouridine synthase [Paenibacillus sp. GCM10027627]|uniref:RluA family pseudouridine synthase n=1 Tax=unclassified Paenibacillus TaxID=185978 RepID=UPI00363E5D02